MGALRQLGALFWKNYVIRKRSPMTLCMEILWPLIIFAGIILMRSSSPPLERGTCSYPERSMPSAGMLPFLQSSVCTITNECQSPEKAQETLSAQQRLRSLVSDLTPVLSKPSTMEAVRALPTVRKVLGAIRDIDDTADIAAIDNKLKLRNMFRDPDQVISILTTKYNVIDKDTADVLMDSTLNVIEVMRSFNNVDFKKIVCEPEMLKKYLVFREGVDLRVVSHQLCNIDSKSVTELTNEVVRHLDVGNLVRVAEDFSKMMGKFDLAVLMEDLANLMDMLENVLGIEDQSLSSAFRQLTKLVPFMSTIQDVDFESMQKMFEMLEPILQSLMNQTDVDGIKSLLQAGASLVDPNNEMTMEELMAIINATDISGLQTVLGVMAGMPTTDVINVISGIMNGSDLSTWNMNASLDYVQGMMGMIMDEMTMNKMMVIGEHAMNMMDDVMVYIGNVNKEVEYTIANSGEFVTSVKTIGAFGMDTTADFFSEVMTTENMYATMTGEKSTKEVCEASFDKALDGRSDFIALNAKGVVCNDVLTNQLDKVFADSGYQTMETMMKEKMDEMEIIIESNVTMATDMTLKDMYYRTENMMMKMDTIAIDPDIALANLYADPSVTEDWRNLIDGMVGKESLMMANVMTTIVMVGNIAEDTTLWKSVGKYLMMTDAALVSGRKIIMNIEENMGPGSTIWTMMTYIKYAPEILKAMHAHILESQQSGTPLSGDLIAMMCTEVNWSQLNVSMSTPAAEIQQFVCNTDWTNEIAELMLTFDPLKVGADLERAFNMNSDLGIDWLKMTEDLQYMIVVATRWQEMAPVKLLEMLMSEIENIMASLESLMGILTSLPTEQLVSNINSVADLQALLGNDTMIMDVIEAMMYNDYISFHLIKFANIQLKYFNESRIVVVRDYLNSTEANKIFRIFDSSTELNKFLMENLQIMVSNPNKVSKFAMSDIGNFCNASLNVFRDNFVLPATSNKTLDEMQMEVCSLEIDMEKLLTELSISLDEYGFNELLQAMEKIGNLTMEELMIDKTEQAKETEMYVRLLTDVITHPPEFILPFSVEEIEMQLMTLLEQVNQTFASQMQWQTENIQEQIYGALQGTLASWPDFNKYLLVMDNYLYVLTKMSQTELAVMLDPDTGYSQYPEMRKLYALMENIPDVLETFTYTLLNDDQKIQMFVAGLMGGLESLCMQDPASLMTVPPGSSFSFETFFNSLCSINMTELNQEQARFTHMEAISNMYLNLENTTEAANLTSLMINANNLMETLSQLMNSTESFYMPRFSNPEVWEEALNKTMAILNESQSQMEVSDIQTQIMSALTNLQSTSPELNGIFNVMELYIGVLQDMVSKGQVLSMDPASDLEDYPELSKMWRLAQMLPELFETYTYTSVNDDAKIMTFIESLEAGLDVFCMKDPADLMTVPPDSTFDFAGFMSTFCSINMTALDMEYSNISKTHAISDAYATLWNSTTTPNMTQMMQSLSQLIEDLSGADNTSLPRMLDPTVWGNTMETVLKYLENMQNNTNTGTTGSGLGELFGSLGGASSNVMATMDAVLDMLIQQMQVSPSDAASQSLFVDPVRLTTMFEAITNLTYLIGDNMVVGAIDDQELIRILTNGSVLLEVCEAGTFATHINGGNITLARAIENIVCADPVALARSLQSYTSVREFGDKLTTIWSTNTTYVDYEKMTKKIEVLISTYLTWRNQTSPEGMGMWAMSLFSGAYMNPEVLRTLESGLNSVVSDIGIQSLTVFVDVFAEVANHLKEFLAGDSLQDPAKVAGLMDFLSSSDDMTWIFTKALSEDVINYAGGIPYVATSICNVTQLELLSVYFGPISKPLSDLSAALCGTESDKWFSAVREAGFTATDVMNYVDPLVQLLSNYTVPTTRSWKRLPDDAEKIAKAIAMFNMSAITDMINNIEPYVTDHQAVILQNGLEGLMTMIDSLGQIMMYGEINLFLSSTAALQKAVYAQMLAMTATGQPIRLSDILPDPNLLADLLNQLSSGESTSAIMLAALQPEQFLTLLMSDSWDAVVCNKTAFMSVFMLPPDIDADQLQKELCSMSTQGKAQIWDLIKDMGAQQALQELNKMGPGSANATKESLSSLFHNTQRMVELFMTHDVDMTGLDLWMQPIQRALDSMGQNNEVTNSQSCEASLASVKDMPYYTDMVKPYLDSISSFVAISNVFMTAQIDMSSVICAGQYTDLSSLISNFNQIGIPAKIQWLTEKLNGQVDDIMFSCDSTIDEITKFSEKLTGALTKVFDVTQPNIIECITETLLAKEKIASDLSQLSSFGSEMLSILTDPQLEQFITMATGSPETMQLIVDFVNQQKQMSQIEQLLQNDISDVSSFFQDSFNVGQETLMAFLQTYFNLDPKTMTQDQMLDAICNSEEIRGMMNSTDPLADLLAALCGPDREMATLTGEYLMRFVSLANQLNDPMLDPDTFWQRLTDDIADLVSNIEGLTELAGLVSSLQSVNISDLGDSRQILRTAQRLLTDKGPDALLESLNKVLDNFVAMNDTAASRNIIDNIKYLADGIFAFKTIRNMLLDNVQIKDLVKDEATFKAYLTVEVGLTPTVANAVIEGALSFEMLIEASQKDITDWVCDPEQLASLLTLQDGDRLNAGYLSNQFCALDSETVTKVLEEVMAELDIGDLMEQVVTSGITSVMESLEVTPEETMNAFTAIRAANEELKDIINQLDNFTQAVPNAVASLASAQTGSFQASSLSGLICGNDDFEIKDDLKVASSVPNDGELNDEQKEELASIKGEACKSIYRDLMSTAEGPVIWGFLKPLLRGKILFTPNTQEIMQLMSSVNSTFSSLAEIKATAEEWADGSVVLEDLVGDQASDLQELLDTQLVKGMITQVADMSANDLKDMLYTLNGTNPELVSGLSNTARMMGGYLQCLDLDRFMGYDTEKDLEVAAGRLHGDNSFMGGIVFTNVASNQDRRKRSSHTLPPHITYKIRMDIDNVQPTERIKKRMWRPIPEDEFSLDLRYFRGFLQLQDMVDNAIIEMQTGSNPLKPAVSTKQFTFPCHVVDSFVSAFSAYLLPVMMTVAMLAAVTLSVNNLVYDRENGQEEILRAMGMAPLLSWWAWFLSTFFILAVIAFLEMIMLRYGNVFIHSNMLLIFLYFLDFIFSTLMLCYFVSSFFTRKSLAILATIIVYFISYLPYVVLITLEVEMKFWQKTLACLSSTSAFSYTAQFIARYEETQVGLQWSNVKDAPISQDDFSFQWGCIMMAIDGAIYLVLGWYVRNVKPGKYGVAQPWYFPVCPTYWGCCPASGGSQRYRPEEQGCFSEQVPSDIPVAMTARGLTKKYGDGTVAVNDLTLDIHCGYVTTLLGHNGAAKTTTMSMLTGVLEPTKGEVRIFNRPVTKMKGSLGICPQQNALFDYMTVQEHMELYSTMKNSTGQAAKRNIKQLLKEVDLWYCRYSLVGELSGGMQRRLCVALAFVGGSKVVILDEPTSGVDPSGRRAIWNLILRRKECKDSKGVGILLSTHHLDEADIISDRIAILHQGKLLCDGSPLFLKQHLASGHRLTVVRENTNKDEPTEGRDPTGIMSVIQQFVAGAKLQHVVGPDMTFLLPASKASNFCRLFQYLETNKQTLSIISFGVSDPTLEEVFLKVCSAADFGRKISPQSVNSEDVTSHPNDELKKEWQQNMDTEGSSTSSRPIISKNQVSGLSLGFQHFGALIAKRVHHYRRNWRMFFSMFFLPLALFVIGLAMYSIRPDDTKAPDIVLSPAMYGPNSYVFMKQKSLHTLPSSIVNTFMKDPGMGTTCMQGMNLGDPYQCVTPDTQFTLPPYDPSTNHSCKCEKNRYTCEGQSRPPLEMTTTTTEILQDLQDRNTEQYLMDSFSEYIEKRYGGFTFNDNSDDGSAEAVVWYNNKGFHALPSFYNVYSNGLLRATVNEALHGPADQYGITVHNHPFLFSKRQLDRDTLLQSSVDVGIAMIILIAFTFLPVGASMFVVTENITMEKHLQFVSGIRSFTYWISSLLWDLFILVVAVACCFGFMAIFKHDSFWDRENAAAAVSLILLYCWCTLPLCYCLSRVFKTAAASFFTMFCTLMFVGLICTMIIFTLNFFKGDNTSLGDAYDICRQVFHILPPYALAGGLVDLITNQLTTDIMERFRVDAYVNPFSLDLIGWNLIIMGAEGLIFFILCVVMETRCNCSKGHLPSTHSSDSELDSDVMHEKGRVDTGNCREDLIIVQNLHKVYMSSRREVHAVNGLSFGVPSGQCFGLLGVNGAGKTTTFNILTGALEATKGDAFLLGKRVKPKASSLGQNMGYCPQTEALDSFLSVEEMLYFHAKLKGLSSKDQKSAITKVMETLQLIPMKGKTVRACSGGMKRKLSLAIALLGDPAMILLDEPTSGMDPKAKRLVWDCLMAAKKNGQAVILTSHSLEECDILCDRIGIMVNGEFRCLGSSQHLKHKFGNGYTVTLNVVGLSTSKTRIYELINQSFPGATIRDQHQNVIQVDIPMASTSVSHIYETLEREKFDHNIMYYTVSQTTLETIFLNFTGDQTDTGLVEATPDSSSTSDYSEDGPSLITPAIKNSYHNNAYSFDGSDRFSKSDKQSSPYFVPAEDIMKSGEYFSVRM